MKTIKGSSHWKKKYNAAATNAANFQAVLIALMMQNDVEEIEIPMKDLGNIHKSKLFLTSTSKDGQNLIVRYNVPELDPEKIGETEEN